MNCPICDTQNYSVVYRLFDDRYGYSGSFELVRCSECRHKFLSCRFSDENLEKLYTDYYPRSSFDINSFRPYTKQRGMRAWLDGSASAAFYWVPRDVRVLDVGCGLGQSLAYHMNRGCDVYGVEADHNIKCIAEKFGFDVHVGLFDPDIYQENFFDYITLHQVIEHFVDPVQALQGIKQVLSPRGTVILTLPNADGWGAKVFGKRWINWHAPYHLQFFSRKSMEIACEKSGLLIEKVKTVTSSQWLYYQWVHMAVYPNIGNSSVFWDPAKKASSQEQKKINKIKRIHRDTKINHVLTRFFDSVGLGDNILYVLKNER